MRGLSRSSAVLSQTPNPAMHLDPSLEALLRDVDMALLKQKSAPSHEHMELTATPSEGEPLVEELEDDSGASSHERKSPAARFGSHHIGQVVIPQQLQNAITGIINGMLETATTIAYLTTFRIGQIPAS